MATKKSYIIMFIVTLSEVTSSKESKEIENKGMHVTMFRVSLKTFILFGVAKATKDNLNQTL